MEEESMNRREALKTMGLAAIGTGLAMTSLGAAESEFKTGKKLKVMLVNGSPHKEGCTFTALSEIAGALKKNGVDSEIFWIGKNPFPAVSHAAHARKPDDASWMMSSTVF